MSIPVRHDEPIYGPLRLGHHAQDKVEGGSRYKSLHMESGEERSALCRPVMVMSMVTSTHRGAEGKGNKTNCTEAEEKKLDLSE